MNGRFGEDMEAKRGFSCFGGFEEDRLALTGVWSFEAGWTGQDRGSNERKCVTIIFDLLSKKLDNCIDLCYN